jgi:pimeloyl-ACP methyl ester carboxylesterase
LRRHFTPDSGRASREMALGVFNVPPRLIRTPMLVVGSERDRFIPLNVAQRVAHRYNAPLHVARGHGHFLFAEPGWQKVAAVILDWIDALPRPIRASNPQADTDQSARLNSPPSQWIR